MAKSYFLSRKDEAWGPFNHDQVLEKLKTSEYPVTGYVFEENDKNWVMIFEHPDFADHIPEEALKSQDKKTVPQPTPLTEKEWFVLKDGNNYGPFSKLEVVQMLQSKALYEFDYVWHKDLGVWKRVADIPEFGEAAMRDLQKSGTIVVNEVFFRRRHLRAACDSSIIVHDNKAVYKGRSIEVSIGGAGLLIENHDFTPGQTIFLHFKPGSGVPPFNAVCQIISKSQARGAASTTRYGVKFTSISHLSKQAIKTFTDQSKRAA